MHQFIVVAVAGAIALAVSSCASEDASVAPSPAAGGSPAPIATAVDQKPPGAQKFSKPLVAQKPAAGTIPGLIQSTNGDEQAKRVQAKINATKGGKDPFTGLPPVLPRVTITARNPVAPTIPNAPRTGKRGISLKAPNVPARNPGVTTAPPPLVPTVPLPPSTTLASGVEVTGVVTVNGVTQAIIKAPNEPTSRYVQVGQRLSNGQVLVKRIDSFAGSDPVVILEENGVEVARVVGDKPLAAAGGNQPQTAPAPAKPTV
jgi:hypothetical protein